MTKELYLEAIEALRRRVEEASEAAAGLEGLESSLDKEDPAGLVHLALDVFIDLELRAERDPLVGLNGALDDLGGEMLERAMAALWTWVWLKSGRDELRQEISMELDRQRPNYVPADSATYAAERAAAVREAEIESAIKRAHEQGYTDIQVVTLADDATLAAYGVFDDDDSDDDGDYPDGFWADDDEDDGDLWEDDPDEAREYED